jgi:ketosteroid isomerase-like protein
MCLSAATAPDYSGSVHRVSQANVELVLRGYWAFVKGDLAAVADMLDPDIEWVAVDPEEATGHESVLAILADRFEDGYRVEIERCVGIGDEVAVSFRVAGEERDASDDRPLQTRRYFTVGRYSAVVTVRGGRVTRVQEYPHLQAALEALGIEDEH